MSDLTLTLTQRPDHVVHEQDLLLIDGDPFIVKAIKPKREAGVYLDWGQVIEYNEVEATVERFDGYDA